MIETPMDAPFDDDVALLEAIRKKDKKVFETFYKKYYKQLFATAYRYVGKQEVAEELVHDLFITIWNKADQLKIQYAMKSYLFRAIVNSSLNYIKKEKMDVEKRLAYISVHGAEEEQDKETDDTLLRNLEVALELLPAKCKQVMYLSRFGKLKQQEIADQMNISLKTVKNHLTYGFRKLREQLGKNGQTIISLLLLLKIMIR